jgi:hypothetical protein
MERIIRLVGMAVAVIWVVMPISVEVLVWIRDTMMVAE